MKKKALAKKSLCVHAGAIEDSMAGGINTPIFTSTSYAYLDRQELLYPRYFNTPNNRVLIDKLCSLEQGEDGIIFSSGMAAISTVLYGCLRSGDHVVFQPGLYGGTFSFVRKNLKQFGIDYTIAPSQDMEDLRNSLQQNTRMIYIETPSNPLLGITDIGAVAGLARDSKILSVIDNTFASPVNQNPLPLGIDVVLHSATKYLGGHSDICAGAVVGSAKIVKKIWDTAIYLGGSLNAETCYLLERSLKTLVLRVEQQNRNAQAVAGYLSAHPGVDKVYYPGLPGHTGYDIACKQMSGFGGMLSFELKNINSDEFQQRLTLIKPSVSLGGVESIVCSPAQTSHKKMTPEERVEMGIRDSLIRLSVGIEEVEDLVDDLRQALS